MTIPFPYVFIRYASLPNNTLQPLQLPGTLRFIQIQQHIAQVLSALQTQLCEELFHLIAAQTNDDARTVLIKLKRHIYNNKPIPGNFADTLPQLPQTLTTGLQQYRHLQGKQVNLTGNWQTYYDTALLRHRQSLQQLANNETLQQGLLLSSHSLYEQLDEYRGKAAVDFRHKELKTEYGLLRYVTRMTFKTSPFSTFTSTGLALLNSECTNIKLPEEPVTQSSVRCNNSLFTYIRDLFLHHPALNELLFIQLNDTVIIEENSIRFLVNYYNIESFQQIPATELIKWIAGYLQQHENVSLGELVNEIAPMVENANIQQVKAYLVKLITAGMLDATIGVSGIHPMWNEELYLLLQKQLPRYPSLQIVCNVLQQLSNARGSYHTLKAAARYELLNRTASQVNQALHQLQSDAGIPAMDEQAARKIQQACLQQWKEGQFTKVPFIQQSFTPANIFFEDSGVKEIATLPHSGIQEFITKAQTLCTLLVNVDPLQKERQQMRNFFLQHYGERATVPVLTFYQNYYSKQKKEVLQIASEQSAANDKPQDKWLPLLQQLQIGVNDSNQIAISCLSQPGKIPDTIVNAMAMFTQFFCEGDRYKGVVNHFLPGMGKIAGRFLYLFDEPVTGLFNKWNNSLYASQLLMELSDGSGFNANSHPPLLPYELHLPGSQHNHPDNGQVSVKDLVIQYDENTQSLILYHPDKQTGVYAFDCSLESFYRRSHLYQLLAHFNTDQRIPLREFNKAIDKCIPTTATLTDNGITSKPRIVFEQDLILRRAGWIVETAGIPAPGDDKSEAAWFVRLHAWRMKHKIPEQVFVYLRSPYLPETTVKQKSARDDHKPQYIHFGMPLLSGVFRKLISRTAQVYIEEMLPHTTHWQQTGEHTRVTEQLIHWYNYK